MHLAAIDVGFVMSNYSVVLTRAVNTVGAYRPPTMQLTKSVSFATSAKRYSVGKIEQGELWELQWSRPRASR